MAPIPAVSPPTPGRGDVDIAIAAPAGGGGVVTARRAGGLRDMDLEVNPREVGIGAALQNMAKGINIAFQTDFGENHLEAVYQAAIVIDDEVRIIHKEYFGFGETWFGELGKLLRSMSLTLQGPDPASPEGRKRIQERGPATIRGLLNLVGRKLDLVSEFEDRVPAFVQQMFDRLEGSGIYVGWCRDDWNIRTTKVGLDIRIWPADHLVKELSDKKATSNKPAAKGKK
jgi:hypothetical protein